MILGSNQEGTERFVLTELRHVSLRHQWTTVFFPDRLVEIFDLTTEGFRRLGVGGCQDLLQRFVVAEKPRLRRHHPVFGSWVKHVSDLKGSSEPLAQARRRDLAVLGGLVPSKENVAKLLAIRAALAKLCEVEHESFSS
jgi:hypothetical protein